MNRILAEQLFDSFVVFFFEKLHTFSLFEQKVNHLTFYE